MSIYGTPVITGKNNTYFPGENISIVNNKISANLYSMAITLAAASWVGSKSPYT